MKFLYVILSFFLIGCFWKSNKTTEGMEVKYEQGGELMEFTKLIDIINNKVIDLTSRVDLFRIEEFITIYETPLSYKDSALLYLTNPEFSKQKKEIALLAMQRMDDSDYIQFSKTVFELYENLVIDEEIIHDLLFYSINNKFQIIRNYDNPDVVEILTKYNKVTNKPEFKQSIDEALSGFMWKQLKRLLKDNKLY